MQNEQFNNNTPRKLNMRQKLSILFGNPVNFFIILLIFPSIPLILIEIYQEVYSLSDKSVIFPESSPEISGKVSDVKNIRFSIDNYDTYEYNFYYSAENDTIYSTSYSLSEDYSAGDTVTLVYLPENPKVVCIKGMSTVSLRPKHTWIPLVIFAGFIIIFIIKIIPQIKILKYVIHGKLAVGTYQRIKKSSEHVQKTIRTIYLIYYQFESHTGKKGIAVHKTYKLENPINKEDKIVVYLDKNLKNGRTLENLPKTAANILYKP